MNTSAKRLSPLIAGLAAVGFGFVATVAVAQEHDRHAGYYYPEPEMIEVYQPRITVANDATARARISFVTAINSKNEERGYAPTYIASVKGVNDEKLIIVGTQDGAYNSLFRIRALLGALTSKSRLTPLFSQVSNPENLTFLDVAYFMGFEQITVSDGDTISHQIVFE